MSLKRNILDLSKRKEIVLQGGGEDAIKKQASDYLAGQERFVMAINRVSIPSLILNTDSMDWTSFAHDILNFSDST